MNKLVYLVFGNTYFGEKSKLDTAYYHFFGAYSTKELAEKRKDEVVTKYVIEINEIIKERGLDEPYGKHVTYDSLSGDFFIDAVAIDENIDFEMGGDTDDDNYI